MNSFLRIFLFFISASLLSSCIPDNLTEFDYKSLQPPSTAIPEPDIVWQPIQQKNSYTIEFGILGDLRFGVNHWELLVKENGVLLSPSDVVFTSNSTGLQLPFQEYVKNESQIFYVLPNEPVSDSVQLSLRINTTISESVDVNYSIKIRDTLWHKPFQNSLGNFTLCWEKPIPSLTGDNPLAFRLFEKIGETWAPVTTYSVSIYPYMDMGGGDGHSTPFTNPTLKANGLVVGSINYVMSGGWELTATVQQQHLSTAIRFTPFYVYEP